MTFNDPSGNIIAIPGGGVVSYIPHPPPPAPPPTPPPVYERTIRSIIVPNTNPAPTDQPTNSQPLSIGDWFMSKPDNWEQLGSLVVGGILLFAPTLSAMFNRLDRVVYNFNERFLRNLR
ncbi:MAG TPA: hypothetical protein VJN71_05770 [Nitrososphaerales archaeon]|nr:hypothetical protein [Nitrososphaerales archaeon]